VVCGGGPLADGEYTLEPVVADDSGHIAVAVLPGGGFVVLDTELTAELEAEGWARDLIRQIQDERKAADLHVSDPIRLRLTVPQEHLATAQEFRPVFERETLAKEIEIVAGDGAVQISLERA
jgi:isoleucyl-tRNA synthetase